jgi:integrase
VNKHVLPVLGPLPVGRLDPETLDSFYETLRTCREHCNGRRYVEHRKAGEHECTATCRPHVCRPLVASSIREVHRILSGALKRAKRWRWIAGQPGRAG